MRTHGTLTKWNDDRGFGFITPAKGPPEVFVHISAFPREGGRPRLNELISFEVEAGKDGKQRAVRVMRPAQPSVARPVPTRTREHSRARRGGGALALLALVAIGVFAWSRFQREEGAASTPQLERFAPLAEVEPESRFSCDGRTRCPEMKSCEEATYFIHNCPNTKMDGDGDGVPCEDQHCGH